MPSQVFAADIIKINISASVQDHRIHFKSEVLTRALERTRDQYGDYEIEYTKYYMNTDRSFKKLAVGETVNVTYALTRSSLEKIADPIRIPVRRGLVSYRLLVVNKDSLEAFKNVETLEDLKKMSVGLDTGWATYDVMKHANFNIVEVADYGSMFNMLSFKRFDFLPRGVNEVFGELERHNASGATLMIEPNLVLKIPSATYIFVSKKTPRIKDRLDAGLSIMAKNGELDQIFNAYFKASLDKAELNRRRVIEFENPFLPKETPVKNKALWLDIDKYYLK